MGAALLVGTEKGAFVFRSDDDRKTWRMSGPLFKGWKVTAAARDERGRFWAGTASYVYGATVHVSDDLEDWTHLPAAPRYAEDAKAKLNQIWTILPREDRVWVGVDDAGLFTTDDGGDSWNPVNGLNEHRTRESWYPGFGGLCAHSLVVDPANAQRMWCGISAVGVFRTEDGGETWTPRNDGVEVIIPDQSHSEIGYCVHALAVDPDDGQRIFRQDHKGMYRTTDGADSWEKIENGLPSGFGFPLVLDRKCKALFCSPVESDEYRLTPDGRLRVWRSRDAGDSWEAVEEGLPEYPVHTNILRCAMSVDHLDPGGVYFGTTSGTVHVSADGGDTWTTLPCLLPRGPLRRGLGGGLTVAGVTVELPSILTSLTGVPSPLTLEGDSVAAVLRALTEAHPSLELHLFDDTGAMRPHVLCFHNDTSTRWMKSLDTPVAEGDRIILMQAVSGG